MALSLSSERSVSAASPTSPFTAIARWIARAQAARTRRVTLMALLDLDQSRLTDLGVSRDDVLSAVYRNDTAAQGLNAARARNARR